MDDPEAILNKLTMFHKSGGRNSGDLSLQLECWQQLVVISATISDVHLGRDEWASQGLQGVV